MKRILKGQCAHSPGQSGATPWGEYGQERYALKGRVFKIDILPETIFED